MKKKKVLFVLVCTLLSVHTKAAYGDTFTANTDEGVIMTFKVINEVLKTCQVGEDSWNRSSISKSTSGKVTIPSTVNGYTVTTIGGFAFTGCNSVTSIVIPNTVEHIGGYAFTAGEISAENLISMNSIDIPSSVKSIGAYAFARTRLTSITIPSSVTDISDSAFDGCLEMTSMTVDTKNTKYDSRNNCNAIIETASDQLVAGISTTVIPSDVKRIGDRAFFGIKGLKEITLSSAIEFIGEYAFYGCENLKTVTIEGNVSTIKYNAFGGCPSLEMFSINRFVPLKMSSYNGEVFEKKNIQNATLYVPAGSKAAYETSYLWKDFKEIVEMPGTIVNITFADADVKALCVANWDVNGDGELCEDEAAAVSDLGWVFRENRKLSSFDELQYFTGLTSIDKFRGCSSLKSVTIPNGVKSINNDAFSSCSALTSITIPNSVTSIGNYAFSSCSALTSITIPNSVTSIGNFVFQECNNLTDFSVASGNTVYDSRDNCNAIIETASNTLIAGCSSTVIPNSVTSIGNGAFRGSGLTSLTIPNSVTSIGDFVFHSCNNLTDLSVVSGNTVYDSRDNCNAIIETASNTLIAGCLSTVIPEDVTSIGNYAFSYCGNLTSITIPHSVANIGNNAFYYCRNLTSVVSLMEEPFIYNSNAFVGISSNCILTVPYGTKDAYIAAGWTEEVFKGGIVEAAPPSPIITFADTKVKAICVANWNTNYDGELSEAEAAAVTDLGEAFKNETEVASFDELPYFTGLTSISESAFEGCTGLASITIPENITSVGASAFSGCSQLASVILPDDIVSMGTNAFDTETKLYATRGSKTLLTLWNAQKDAYEKTADEQMLPPSFNAETTQTTAKVTVENWYDGYTYQYNGEETTDKEFNYTGLKPESIHDLTLTVLSDNVQYEASGSFTTQSFSPHIEEWTATASSVSATGAYTEGDAKVVASSIQLADNNAVDGNQCYVSGLDPDRSYTVTYTIEVDYGGEETATYTGTLSVSTDNVNFETAQPKVVSEGNVIVSATANLDENEENVGFEWRSTDWTEEFPSNTGKAYLYEGTMEGYIKNLNTNKLWKCRPYYLSAGGDCYYGDWMGIDPTNTSYFEPTVHTYSNVIVEGNTVQVKGYALNGTDEVKAQGFKYWKANRGGSARNRVVAIPADVMTIEVEGQQMMTANIEGLDYDTEYCCVAFVTTTDGDTFYGEEQIFTTGEDPTDIESVETEGAVDAQAIEVARYNMNGQQITTPQKGVNIIQMSDGTTRKVYVK